MRSTSTQLYKNHLWVKDLKPFRSHCLSFLTLYCNLKVMQIGYIKEFMSYK
ncbi:hypothetical protein Golob_023024, partial [Gossypium lobatum]|nr:hypothetical protein [Gossypium lobatum]